MENYKKVEKEKVKAAENEIRVSVNGEIRKYLGYAHYVLEKSGNKFLTIKATGNAIGKAMTLVELVKRKIG